MESKNTDHGALQRRNPLILTLLAAGSFVALLAAIIYLGERLETLEDKLRFRLVEKWDHEGGSGANFIVTWDAETPVYEPIVEAVMVGLSKEHNLSFISPGRALVQRKQ